MKYICFDIDGTITKENSWYKLNTALGMSPERDQELFDAYKNGDLSYEQWQEQILASYKKTEKSHKEIIQELCAEPELLPEARFTIEALQSKGYTVFLISGSYDVYVASVARALGGLEYRACSTIIFDDEGYIQNIQHLGDEQKAKRQLLEAYADEHGVAVTDIICVGDGPNDIELFQITGKGITFTGSPIEEYAWKVVDTLEEIPHIV